MTDLNTTPQPWKPIYIIMVSRFFLKKKNEQGFTLMETIVALGIGLLANTMIFYIFTLGLKNIRTIKNTESLHSNANFFLNTLTYWIKQGKNLEVLPASPGNILEITLPDNSTTTIDKSLLEINGVSATTTFKKMEKSIQLNFIIQKGSASTSATTTIAQRTIQ